jgi:hypothetical protein
MQGRRNVSRSELTGLPVEQASSMGIPEYRVSATPSL